MAQRPPPEASSRLPTWVDVLDLITAILAGLWVPLKFGLLVFPRSTDLGVDILFAALAGPCACVALRRAIRLARAGVSRQLIGLGLRLILDLAVALPLVTAAGLLLGVYAVPLWCVKLLAVRHVQRFPDILSRVGIPHPALGRLISLVIVVPLFVHWIATGWVLMGGGPESPNLELRYMRAVYWAITTLATVGYGDITPQTPMQMVYACGVMVAGVGFFGFVLGNVASLLARLDAAKIRQEEIRTRVEMFMRYHRVPAALRRRVRDYLQFLWESRSGYDDAEILATLPVHLRTELSMCVNRELLQSVPLLKGASPELIRDLVMELTPMIVTPGEEICRYGETGDEMYFILHGDVDILAPSGERLAQLHDGSFFGEMALVTNKPRQATARAVGYGDLYVLNRRAVEDALAHYPEFAAQVARVVQTRTATGAEPPPPPAS